MSPIRPIATPCIWIVLFVYSWQPYNSQHSTTAAEDTEQAKSEKSASQCDNILNTETLEQADKPSSTTVQSVQGEAVETVASKEVQLQLCI